MTLEQAKQLIEETWNSWVSQNPQTAALLTDSDHFLLGKSIGNRLKVVGHIAVGDFSRAIENFLKFGQSNGVTGRLTFQQQQQPAPLPPPAKLNPIDRLPHSDIKALAHLRTLADVRKFQGRVAKDGLDFMSGFKALREGEGTLFPFYSTLNERLNYIREHKIEAEDDPQRARPSQPTQPGTVTIPLPPVIAEAHTAVNAMTLADVGQTGSSAGRRTLLVNKQKRLHAEINQMWRDSKKQNVILQWVRDEIKRFGESSIR